MDGQSVGKIYLDLGINQSGISKELNGLKSSLGGQMGKMTKGMTGINSLMKKFAGAATAAFSVAAVTSFTKSCLDLGSDLAEVQNVVDTTFPGMNNAVNEWAINAKDKFGLSETMAKQFTGTFGAMSEAFGFTEKQAYEMSTSLTGLAGDVASFYNITQDEAYTKLKSVFSGETESLKDLGVVMTQTALDQYALENGFGKTTKAMTEQEKVSLRLAFVTDRLKLASGDFSKTSDSWANQCRILSLNLQSIKATLGQGFINLFTPIIKVVNTLVSKLSILAGKFVGLTELLTGKKIDLSGAKAVADSASSAGDDLSNASGSADDLNKSLKKTAKTAKMLMGFDQMNKLEDTSSDSDSGNSSGTSAAGAMDAMVNSALDGWNAVDSKIDGDVEKWANKIKSFLAQVKTDIKPTTDAIKKLWDEGFSKFATFSWTALKDWYEDLLKPLAKYAVGEGLPKLLNILNDMLNEIDWDTLNGALDDVWKALEPLEEDCCEGLLWALEKVFKPMGVWAGNTVLPTTLETIADSLTIIKNVGEPAAKALGKLWDALDMDQGVLDLLKSVSSPFVKLSDAIKNLKNMTEKGVSLDGLFKLTFDIASLEKDVNEFVKDPAEWIAKKLFGHLGLPEINLVPKLKLDPIDIGFKLSHLTQKDYDDAISGIKSNKVAITITAVKDKAFELVKVAWDSMHSEQIKKTISAVKAKDWKGAKEAWDNWKSSTIKKTLSVVGKDKVDKAKKVWDSLKSKTIELKTKLSSSTENLKKSVNDIIDYFNKNFVAKLKFSLKNPITGKNHTIGPPPNIKKLAQGGYVKANTPQLAMIGDNRHQGEVVAPEDKLLEMALKAAELSNTSAVSVEMISLLKEILQVLLSLNLDIYMDGEKVTKRVVDIINMHTTMNGTCEIR